MPRQITFKPVTPGMIIHVPDREADQDLSDYLYELGLGLQKQRSVSEWRTYFDQTCYRIPSPDDPDFEEHGGPLGFRCECNSLSQFREKYGENSITEFDRLIESESGFHPSITSIHQSNANTEVYRQLRKYLESDAFPVNSSSSKANGLSCT